MSKRDVTLVTGVLRSGTSCITGLLVKCGFDMGKRFEVSTEPDEYNPKGHFEVKILVFINTLIVGTIFYPPSEEELSSLGNGVMRYIRYFTENFDGDLCKDPFMCLTISHWEKNWPQLKNIVFCFRNPLSVAHSIKNRYKISLERALNTWFVYNTRFLKTEKRSRVYLFDFDEFLKNPLKEFGELLEWLGKGRRRDGLRSVLKGFYERELVNWMFSERDLEKLPKHITTLYSFLKQHKGPLDDVGFNPC